MANFALKYGKGQVEFSLPEENVGEIVEGQAVTQVKDVKAAVLEALRHPRGTAPLADIVVPGDKVTIVVSDITRSWIRYDLFLPYILDELNGAGVPDADITLLVALGAHRCHTEAEHSQVYGQTVVSRVKIIQNRPQEADDFVYMGTTSRGVAAYQNKAAVQADKVILTGGIVYHSMAGFGGGRKSILPGISRYDTIQGNHRFCLHEVPGQGISPQCDNGRLAGNPMNEDLMEMAAMLDADFLFNVIPTVDGGFAGFVAGHWDLAWQEGCNMVEKLFGVPVQGRADLVIASAGGYPKDINFYQATKALDNGFSLCKPEGCVILLMECPDIAEPPDFSGWFNYDLYEREMKLREAFTVPGFIALKCGLAARRVPHIVVTLPENRAFVTKAGMLYAADMEAALAIAGRVLGKNSFRAAVMPHGAVTVPILPAE